jgi:2'-5' RNA ligase
VGSTSLMTVTTTEPRDHWLWRPEWTPDRTCLYWYLTPRGDEVARALGDDVLGQVADTDWLDAVPPQWCHVTLADVGFTDELDRSDVDKVRTAVADAVGHEEPLRLGLGPVQTQASALVLAVGPLDRLRPVREAVRRTASAVLGPRHADVHRRLFWPHLSLGYVNRPVDAETVGALLDRLPPVSAQLDVDTLTLAAVTRRDRRYQWQVEATVDLLGDSGRPPTR